MAKTQWANGSHITPTFMTAFSGKNGTQGHAHDAADVDGSCPRIVLSGGAQVSGELPLANIATQSSGTVAAKITTTYLTVEQLMTITWQKFNDFVSLYIPATTGTSNLNEMQIAPSTTWPAAIIPSSLQYTEAFYLRNDTSRYLGQLRIPIATNVNIIAAVYIPSTPILSTTGFTASNTKGFDNITVQYHTD